jgi:hypothetical protein
MTSFNLGVVLGGLISGLLGIFAVEYRLYRVRKKELSDWEEQLKTHLDLLSDLDTDSPSKEERIMMYRRASEFNTILQKHLQEAPSSVSNEVINPVNAALNNCLIIVANYDKDDRMIDIEEQYEKIIEDVNKAEDSLDSSKVRYWPSVFR